MLKMTLGLGVLQLEERSCLVVWWYASGYFYLFARWQQGEHIAAGVDVLLVSFGFWADI